MQDSTGISAQRGQVWRMLLAGTAVLALTACQDGFDMDVRGGLVRCGELG